MQIRNRHNFCCNTDLTANSFSSPGHITLKVHAVMERVHKAVGTTQGGESVLGHISTIHELKHRPGVTRHILFKTPKDMKKTK